jgi:multimeric flavodoxin WrbA
MEIVKYSKKPKILLIQGSPRVVDNCPNFEGKTMKIVKNLINKFNGFVDIQLIDLSVRNETPIIQPCKGCISTAGGIHCTYPCSCYFKGDNNKPDLMYEHDIYEKLKWCDGFFVLSPIHWQSVSTQVKTMFDRLVCINLTLTTEKASELLKDDVKNSEITGKIFKSGIYNKYMKNHYEGKYGSFLIHGDNGATDYNDRELPKSYDINKELEPYSSIQPIVIQCKYSGIYVPDDLVECFYLNENKDYYTANFEKLDYINNIAEKLMNRLINYINN